MVKFKAILKDQIDPQDLSWSFSINDLPKASRTNKHGLVKFVSVVSNASKQEISVELTKSEPCRAISNDPPDKFIHISFSDFRLRYPSQNDPLVTERSTTKESAEYIVRVLQRGIEINGVRYHFYGHSNSQLKSRSCILFAGSKDELSKKVTNLGDFSKIKSVAKKAKRIGLLFSTTSGGITLREYQYEDIPDIQNKDYNFTDGCGLISVSLVKELAKQQKFTFRNVRYTPSVLQIRYRGYKGVLTLEPTLRGNVHVQFRDSMRKFKDAVDLTLSVVDYSKVSSRSFGRKPGVYRGKANFVLKAICLWRAQRRSYHSVECHWDYDRCPSTQANPVPPLPVLRRSVGSHIRFSVSVFPEPL